MRKVTEAAMQSSTKPIRWDFPKDALLDIQEAREINATGEYYISANALAKALKDAYKLPVSVKTIAGRLSEMHGGRWNA